MNITNYRVTSMQEVTDLQAAKMADYDEYARRCVVEQLARHISKTCDIKREMVSLNDPFLPPRVRFSTEVYVFTREQLQNIINKEISNAFMEKGLEYATKR